MARVFISYKREDSTDFSRRLRDDIGRRGHEPWLDDQIAPAQLWTEVIEQAIDGSQAVIAVLSANYHLSRVARMEIQRAFNNNTPLLPLLVAAGSSTPLLLEGLQYVDFTVQDAYDAGLTRLVEWLNHPQAVWLERGGAAPSTGSGWASIFERARQQTQRFLDAHQGRPEQPADFIAELTVRREAIEDACWRFLDSPAVALVLIGEPGVGKTTLLCQLAQDLLNAGHAVLPYDCGALADAEVEREIARDLQLGSDDRLTEALANTDGGPAGDRKIVVIFDSLNEFPGDAKTGAATLFRRINALVGRLDSDRVRIVISCSTASWTHMNRHAPVRLDPGRYFHPEPGDTVLRMRAFTAEELARAYPLYQKSFGLFSTLDGLGPELRLRLRDPVLLRLTAEVYRGVQQPLDPDNLALRIYRRFFDERVRLPREAWLVDELAAEMLTRGVTSLPITELARHPQLGPEILSEDSNSTFARLLDRGVLQEWQADLRAGTLIKFAHSRVAAYAMALHLLQRQQSDLNTVAGLVARAGPFPLAWEIALALLLLSRSDATVAELAAARDLDQRELSCEALVQLHAEDAVKATALMRQLLLASSEEARRTALKAAYSIGPPARAIFLRAAIDGEPALRDSVRSTLYLIWRNESPAARRNAADALYVIWRHAPGFTYDVLSELLDQLTLKNILRVPGILEFIVDVSITIYINHCDRPDVIEKTADLYHDLATKRLYLDRLNTGIFGSGFESLVFRAVARVFSGRILDWMLFGEVVPAQRYFDLPKEHRAPLARVADVLDPAAHLTTVEEDLASMLQSELPVFSGVAALAIAVHACRNFAATEPLVRRLFDRSTQAGRLWLLTGFTVLLPETPPEWLPMLEDLTRRYATEHRDAFVASDKLLGTLDGALLPLGLAYGKQGTSMPVVRTMLEEAIEAGDTLLAARCISALGPVGFHYPEAVLELLRPAAGRLGDDRLDGALLTCLATVRTIHFDAVDLFLHQIGAPDSFRRRIDAAADVELVRRQIHMVGYYNNAVHYTLNYPKMRRQLAMGALKLLAEAKDPQQFVADYTTVAVRMFRDSGYQLREWTRPD